MLTTMFGTSRLQTCGLCKKSRSITQFAEGFKFCRACRGIKVPVKVKAMVKAVTTV